MRLVCCQRGYNMMLAWSLQPEIHMLTAGRRRATEERQVTIQPTLEQVKT